MKKLQFMSIILLLTTSYIQTSSIIRLSNQLRQNDYESERENRTINPLQTNDQQNADLRAAFTSTASIFIVLPHQNHPPFDRTKGSVCQQAIASYCADTKTCCISRTCNTDYSNLSRPVAQCRNNCLEAEACCAQATCCLTLICLTVGSAALALNCYVIP